MIQEAALKSQKWAVAAHVSGADCEVPRDVPGCRKLNQTAPLLNSSRARSSSQNTSWLLLEDF